MKFESIFNESVHMKHEPWGDESWSSRAGLISEFEAVLEVRLAPENGPERRGLLFSWLNDASILWLTLADAGSVFERYDTEIKKPEKNTYYPTLPLPTFSNWWYNGMISSSYLIILHLNSIIHKIQNTIC